MSRQVNTTLDYDSQAMAALGFQLTATIVVTAGGQPPRSSECPRPLCQGEVTVGWAKPFWDTANSRGSAPLRWPQWCSPKGTQLVALPPCPQGSVPSTGQVVGWWQWG